MEFVQFITEVRMQSDKNNNGLRQREMENMFSI